MSDVFVSYKAEDRARVRPLVAALEADGLTVWWDAQIQGGAAWRQSIQHELERAGCILVVWSKRSVGPEGEFVHDEASMARKRGVYLPVRIDAVEPPLGFGQTQALALTGWKGERSDPRYQALLGAARGMIGGEAWAGSPPAPERKRIDRRLLLAGGGVLAAGAAGAGGWALWGRMGGGSDEKGIAVLPFANLSGDPAQAYFADGIAEELRSALARIGELKVIGRASCEAVRDAPLTEAAKKLGVGNILTGSVRRSPSLIRVSAQLIDGHDGSERWSETYDRAPGDALEIQSGIAESVAAALQLRLGDTQKAALTLGGTRNAGAHDLVLRAAAQLNADDSHASSIQALSLLDAALALDPGYADAHAKRAVDLANMAGQDATSAAEYAALMAQATAAARRAIELAPRLASGHQALGLVIKTQLDMGGALAEYQRAYALAGDDAQTVRNYAVTVALLGHSREALALVARAVALDPLDISSRSSLSRILFLARRYAEAEAAARGVLAAAPKRSTTRLFLADSLLLQGKVAEAQAEYAKLPADFVFRLVGGALVAARAGDRAGAEAALVSLEQMNGDLGAYQYGQILAQIGEIDRAFAALDRAWAVRDPGLQTLRADPFVDPLRGDPRFKALEAKLNFPA
jgi:serine/threonine-protein kinase